MTKIFVAPQLHCIAAQTFVRGLLGHSAKMLADHLFGILNLGHWNLFEIWVLVLVIFMICIKQVTFFYSVNYLFKRRRLVHFISNQDAAKFSMSCLRCLNSLGVNLI